MEVGQDYYIMAKGLYFNWLTGQPKQSLLNTELLTYNSFKFRPVVEFSATDSLIQYGMPGMYPRGDLPAFILERNKHENTQTR